MEKEKKKGFFAKLKDSLTRTRENISDKVDELVVNTRELDDDFFDELADILVMADVGTKATQMVVDQLRERVKQQKNTTPEQARAMLKEIVAGMMRAEGMRLPTPTVLLIIGVNGVGKTTTIGKLAVRLMDVGRRVVLCAGDTFRAAAAEQLEVWAQRANAPLVRMNEGADPAAVVFEGVQMARQTHADVLIVDTAGRLHNKAHLMEELKKMARVIAREYPQATVRALLVIDATTGQNGVNQARIFSEVADLDGIVLTKMDGTAKGGIAVAIRQELGLPVRYICVGEGIEDMQPFDAQEFADAIL